MDVLSIYIVLAGLMAALISAPMGCLIQWHRLAFLADTLGHSAILGVALAIVADVNMYYGVGFISVVIVLLIVQSQKGLQMPSESILAIISQVGLAAGLLLMSQIGGHSANDGHNHSVDFRAVEDKSDFKQETIKNELIGVTDEHGFEHTAHQLLFGDILSATYSDVIALTVVATVIIIVLAMTWKKLLLISMSWEISQAEGLSVHKYNLIMYVLMALMVSVLVKVMGILLIAALLVIPPTAVRWFSINPEKMVVFTFVFSALSVVLGFAVSAQWDLLTAPSIVLITTMGLLMSQFLKKVLNKH